MGTNFIEDRHTIRAFIDWLIDNGLLEADETLMYDHTELYIKELGTDRTKIEEVNISEVVKSPPDYSIEFKKSITSEYYACIEKGISPRHARRLVAKNYVLFPKTVKKIIEDWDDKRN